MTWGEDPTDRIPTPSTDQCHGHHYREQRGEAVGVAAIVLLTFIIGAAAVLASLSTLSGTIDRLMAVPMCQETHR